MNKLVILEDDARESIVAVLSDLAVRKLSAFVWYARADKKQALRTLASGVTYLDSAVLASVYVDEDADIRQEYIRIKNFVINGCPDYPTLSEEIDGLSTIAYYINNNTPKIVPKSDSLVDFW